MVTIAQRGLPSAVRSIGVDVERRARSSTRRTTARRAGRSAASRTRCDRSAGRTRRARTRRACGSAGVCAMPTSVGRSRLRPFDHSFMIRLRQQDVLAARQRVGVDADQAQQPADEPVDLVADDLDVAHVGRRPQRADDVDADAAARARRVDREVGAGRAARRCRRADRPQPAMPFDHAVGLRRGELGDRLPGLLRRRPR